MQSDSQKAMRVTLKKGCCSLSGLQNQCVTMHDKGIGAADIARYCLNSIGAAVSAMTMYAAEQLGDIKVIYAGGVMSDLLIRQQLQKLPLQTAFSEPKYSCDNAAGVAVYAARMEGLEWESLRSAN